MERKKLLTNIRFTFHTILWTLIGLRPILSIIVPLSPKRTEMFIDAGFEGW